MVMLSALLRNVSFMVFIKTNSLASILQMKHKAEVDSF